MTTRTFITMSTITGSFTSVCGEYIIPFFTLRRAIRVACRRYQHPIVRVLTRDRVTGRPIGWVIRERARHELAATHLRPLCLA